MIWNHPIETTLQKTGCLEFQSFFRNVQFFCGHWRCFGCRILGLNLCNLYLEPEKRTSSNCNRVVGWGGRFLGDMTRGKQPILIGCMRIHIVISTRFSMVMIWYHPTETTSLIRLPGTTWKTDSQFHFEQKCLEDDPSRNSNPFHFFFGVRNVLVSERRIPDLTNRFALRWGNVMNYPLHFSMLPTNSPRQMPTIGFKRLINDDTQVWTVGPVKVPWNNWTRSFFTPWQP